MGEEELRKLREETNSEMLRQELDRERQRRIELEQKIQEVLKASPKGLAETLDLFWGYPDPAVCFPVFIALPQQLLQPCSSPVAYTEASLLLQLQCRGPEHPAPPSTSLHTTSVDLPTEITPSSSQAHSPPMKARLPLVLPGALSYRRTLFLLPPQQPHLSLKFSSMRSEEQPAQPQQPPKGQSQTSNGTGTGRPLGRNGSLPSQASAMWESPAVKTGLAASLTVRL
ncbi:hypothetical protein U0070_006226 [Myodes glareolus]|uniref:Uncharacterized protein n=1 Tax=Myodes glareolus TaxID=447135 RepID=A0AAW0I6U3_MYOGA